MKTKKIVIFSGIALLLILAVRYGLNKAKKLLEIFEKMTIEPYRISSPDISSARIKFNLSVKLTNPTSDVFEISGLGVARLKRIDVFYNNTFLATANVDIEEISIPASNELIIHSIPVEVPEPIKFALQNVALVYELATNFKEEKLSCTGVIEIAGQEIEI